MIPALLADLSTAQLWYSLPLVIVVSLVYGATRHEHLKDIVSHSIRGLGWIVFFMIIIFLLVWWFSRGL